MRLSLLLGCSAAVLVVAACSGTTITQNNVVLSGGLTSSGGASVVGGSSSTGGTSRAGGSTNVGGTSSYGGITSIGGAIATGGISPNGGTTASGGVMSTGGTNSIGGMTPNGGVTSTGGAISTGGINATGGTSATGGTPATGGAISTGGTNATGGMSATGGTSASCPTGMINCLGSCHDLTSDFNNCGNCGYKCGAGQECVLSGCLTALPSHPVWVTNNAQVQVVDPAAGGGIVATIDVGGTTSDLAITPNRLKTYVTNIVSNNVSVISTASRAVTATIPVGTSPVHVAVTPDGSRVYVSNSGSKTLSVIDSTTDTVITSISLTAGVGGLAVKPDGTQLWVSAGYGPDILNVLSIPDHTVIHSAGAGSGFIGDFMRFLPNGSVLYAGSGCGCCGNVRLFNGTTFAAITSHSWGNPGAGVAISPSGPWVYGGATGSGCNGVSTLVKMDGQTGTILSQAALAVTSGMAISPDGTSLYVIQFNTTNLVVVDADSLAPVRTIVLGGTPGIGEVQ